jgi:phage terminase large subunit
MAEFATWVVELRGAPGRLIDDILEYTGPKKVREYLIEGAGGTGKTRGCAEVLWAIASEFPGIRILVVRETRESLTESFCKTLEQDVLVPGDPALRGASRNNRHSYIVRKRDDDGRPIEGLPCSEIVLGGMDNEDNLFSTDYDIVYFVQAEQTTLEKWSKFRRALRNWGNERMRLQLLIADVNPDAPDHFLNQRADDGHMIRLLSKHEDNPRWYNADTDTWSEEGEAYIDSLDSMPEGPTKDRLRWGKWSSTEGAVWPEFRPALHLIEKPIETPKWYFAAKDWGFTAPGCLIVWGVDGEGRMYAMAEWYMTGKTLDWWCERACEADAEFNLLSGVYDPARPDAGESFNQALAGRRGSKLSGIFRPAINRRSSSGKGDLSGIDLVRQRLVPAADGKPRIFWLKDALRHAPDPSLQSRGLPWCNVQEIPRWRYIALADGRPNREHTDPACADHGCDVDRYAASFAHEREWGPAEVEQPKYDYGTYGHLFGHEDFEEN